ncbi:MAG: phosphoenolpyruvate carboxylase [Porticoccaceae bacterium]|nr:phosphoenolpyruvate carboxylase [Porticoccaceae bacterium]
MSEVNYEGMRANVSLLGTILGEIISDAEGAQFLEKIEKIRLLSKSAKAGNAEDGESLLEIIRALKNDELVPVARAFSQFLNLANIADQQHSHSREMDDIFSATETLKTVFNELQANNISTETINESVKALTIDLVLTAHPTEITRRSLIHKYDAIDACLGQLELQGQTQREKEQVYRRLRELITQIWFSHDFRVARPSPVDEAKWGFAVVENSLWRAVPDFLRRLDTTLFEATGERLALDATPVSFTSWMGGDRDGNPNVTSVVTQEVLLLSRWQAAHLYLQAVNQLIDELSMTACNETLKTMSGNTHEPYRSVLRDLRNQLQCTLQYIEEMLKHGEPSVEGTITHQQQLWLPVHSCYQSLIESGMESVANGATVDLLRRIQCFGVHLVRHDIRQDSGRHTQVLSEICSHLGLGDYEQWDEAKKQQFLLAELDSHRPLIGRECKFSEDAREVVATFNVIAQQPKEAFGGYVISMARQPSDILAVQLLLKETGCDYSLPVVPLFETLDDLNRAPLVIKTLLSKNWFKKHIDSQLMVMIGYSDSAKDAGVMAASWAQYTAQEKLLDICHDEDIKLTLFHGRGGSIGRGGAPAQAALLSQPPGSLKAGLRVTEQGETIRAKLGLSAIAIKTLALYTNAVLKANLLEPPRPQPHWRDAMNEISELSCSRYREYVKKNANFVSYFRHATPEQELTKLPLGSRPARRNKGGGVESLRAIPWIFAWSQNRLMLPAWLGAGEGLQKLIDSDRTDLVREMADQWPFFAARLSMLEMVFAKSDAWISAYYDDLLVPQSLKVIGQTLREQLAKDSDTIMAINGDQQLLAKQAWPRESVDLRNIYIHPLNVLQAELLLRNRKNPDAMLEQAIMVTIAGVSAGLRNTG